jgi:hypothetical protein
VYLHIGVRWDVGPIISADEVIRILGFEKILGIFPPRKACPVVVMHCDGKQVIYFEKRVVAEDGSMSDPLFLTCKLERYFSTRLGFTPERVIVTSTGIITWKDYWDAVGKRLEAMPRTTFRYM